MPEPTTAEVKPISAPEVLTYGRKVERPPDVLKKALERSGQLKKQQAEGQTQGDIFRQYASEGSTKPFTERDAKNIEVQFGAGEAKINEKGEVEAPPDTDPDAKELFERGQKAVDMVRGLNVYTEIQQSLQKGEKIGDVLLKGSKEQGWPTNEGEWNLLADSIADYVLSTDLVKNSFSEVFDKVTDANQRRRLAEYLILNDPAISKVVQKNLEGIVARMKVLPQVEKSAELIAAENQKKTTEQTISQKRESLINRLANEGIIPDQTTIDDLQKILEGTRPEEALSTKLREILKNSGKFPDMELFDQHMAAEARVTELESEVTRYTNNETQAKSTIAQTKQDEWKQAYEALGALKTQLQSKAPEYNSYLSLTQGIKLDIQGLVSDKAQLDNTIRILNTKQAEAEASGQSKLQRGNRLAQEANLLADLENILPKSIAEVMAQRYDEMVALQAIETEQEAKKAEEAGDKTKAEAIRIVGKIGNRWVENDPRTREQRVHKQAMATDMRTVVYEGPDGIKRLMLRELSSTPPFATVDENGNVTAAMEWRNVDLATLNDAQKKLLGEVYANQGEATRTRLFADFFTSRGFIDRIGGELFLKDHELALLEKNFSGEIDNALGKSQEAKAMVASLEKRGVKVGKGLLWLIMLLIGTATLSGKSFVS